MVDMSASSTSRAAGPPDFRHAAIGPRRIPGNGAVSVCRPLLHYAAGHRRLTFDADII
jgi:hypothetical protein